MIVLLESVHPDALARLQEVDDVRVMDDPLVVDGSVPRDQVTIVLTRGRGRITAAMLDEFPHLAVVGRCGAGLDNIDVAAAAARGIAVVHAPGATTAAVAEHAVLLMLGLARRLSVLDTAVKDGDWAVRDGYSGTELGGKRLGIVGLGHIGRRVGELGSALGMHVRAWSRSAGDGKVERVELDELLSGSDVVQVCVALTPDTRHLLDGRRLALLRESALLVNTARGAIVDHTALVAALAAGRIAGYATDVWDPEPPPLDDVAAVADRLLVTPHVAAMTDVTYRQLCMTTVEAALAALSAAED
jgi:phosphoglycerate dehydrogenase-like enzyme